MNLTYGNSPTDDPIELDGSQLSCGYGSGTIAFPSLWPLPHENLTASSHYLVWLSAGEVQVAQTG